MIHQTIPSSNTLTSITYHNDANASSTETESLALSAGASSPGAGSPAQILAPNAGGQSPFAKLNAGEMGVRQIDSYVTGSSSPSDLMTMSLQAPLCWLDPSIVDGIAPYDLSRVRDAMPIIYDGACLNVLLFSVVLSKCWIDLKFGWS